jgi:hypothetical protein
MAARYTSGGYISEAADSPIGRMRARYVSGYVREAAESVIGRMPARYVSGYVREATELGLAHFGGHS